MNLKNFKWPYIALIIAMAAVLSYAGKTRLAIDMDITRSLPIQDRVIADARYVMTHHPIKDRIAIDLSCSDAGVDTLVAGAIVVENRLAKSGLFRTVGLDEYQNVFPALIMHIMENLPVLFTGKQLESQVAPLLEPGRVREIMANNYSQIANLEGIGQAGMISADPLGLKNLVLMRMSHLAPSKNVRIVNGHLVSSDGRHVLITAEPKGSATDTGIARKIDEVIRAGSADLLREYGPRGISFKLTPVGAYRAAIDNEDTAKKDSRTAVIVATIGIVILLLVGFPRPYIGILALAPAVLGTIAATFVYSLFSREISILAIGFGGTIISFTVDYGIAYLLFLDRPHETRGMEATKEVWGLGLLSMLTTAASFAFLFLSGFPTLAQIGFFACMGVVFTYIFVHTLFPVVFPVMPPSRRKGLVPLQKWTDRMMGSASLGSVYAAAAIFLFMLCFARLDFRVDLASMNTVSTATLRAEDLVTKTWGNVLSNLYLMDEGGSVEELQRKGDAAAGLLEKEIASGTLSGAFIPSMIFPGSGRMKENLASWNAFWTPARVAALKKSIRDASLEVGFSPGAFDGFYRTLARRDFKPSAIPDEFHGMLGIQRINGGKSWAQFSVLKPGPSYRAGSFFPRITGTDRSRLFDPVYFADRLGSIMLDSFIRMAVIVGVVTFIVAILYLMDLRLTLVSLAPTVFSLVCTFGTLRLIGQKPGIPAIIVTVIVIGMGTDYALYLVRAYQRYMDRRHPSVSLIRLTVFLSAVSTMIGFGVLGLADHSLLRNAGLTLLFGIGYSFLGTVMIVPPLLARLFVPAAVSAGVGADVKAGHLARVERRYRRMEPYPRLMARYRLMTDPLYRQLGSIAGSPATIVDVAAGYGITAAWMLERNRDARVYGLEPDEKRRRVASRAIAPGGTVTPGAEGDMPDFPGKADLVLIIDLAHRLDDAGLARLLEKARKGISADGTLVVRAPLAGRRRSMLHGVAGGLARLAGGRAYDRSEEAITGMLERAGFNVSVAGTPKGDGGKKLFVGKPKALRRDRGTPAAEPVGRADRKKRLTKNQH